MHAPLRDFLRGKHILIVVAAEIEAKAIAAGIGAEPPTKRWEAKLLAPQVDMVLSGVGKANAAAATARTLDLSRHGAVLSLGIAGSYGKLRLGDVAVANRCVYADEGVQTPSGFVNLEKLGFPPVQTGMSVLTDINLVDILRNSAGTAVGPIATVSTCSGTDALAKDLERRAGAFAESMEGAAVAHVAFNLGLPAAELRVISNTAGDRDKQVWDMPGALKKLEEVSRLLFAQS